MPRAKSTQLATSSDETEKSDRHEEEVAAPQETETAPKLSAVYVVQRCNPLPGAIASNRAYLSLDALREDFPSQFGHMSDEEILARGNCASSGHGLKVRRLETWSGGDG